MKANVTIKLMKFLLSFLFLIVITSCNNNLKKDFFEQSFSIILDKEFSYKLKYVVPKYDSINNKIIEVPFADADTMPKLKVYVQKASFSLENLTSDYVSRAPKEFQKPLKQFDKHQDFFSKDIKEYKSDNYDVIFFSDYTKIANSEKFKKYDISNGGMLQISNVVFNKEKNKALLLVRWYRGKRNGNDGYYILSLENGKWIFKKSIELSVS